MQTYYLTRKPSTPQGTLGFLHDEARLCFTIELPWLDNHPQTSCIPVGAYSVDKYISPRHGHVWLINNVPNRSMIELHAANTIKDLKGCIGLGESIGVIDGLPAVTHSQVTLALLREVLPDNFTLVIQNET